MFSNTSYKYLKSLKSSNGRATHRPAQFENEFIMFAQTLTKGLNYQSGEEYFLEHALPDREDHGAMTGLILNGNTSSGPNIQVKSTSDGKFYIEVHGVLEHRLMENNANTGNNSGQLQTFLESTVFDKYFTFHSDMMLEGQYQFVRFEIPLRQIRSRNLLEYSMFVLDLVQPFMDIVKEELQTRQQSAAA